MEGWSVSRIGIGVVVCGLALYWLMMSYAFRNVSESSSQSDFSLRSKAGLQALFPASGQIAGWKRKGKPAFFSGQEIFDYMDGAGELPRSYGYRILGTALYRKDKTMLEIVIFDMGSSAAAFGYYSVYHSSPNDKFVQLEHRARVVPGYMLIGWKGRYTIIVQTEEDKVADELLTQFAKTVMANIKEKGAPPDLLHYLPDKERIADSERYVRGKPVFDNAIMFLPKDVLGLEGNAVPAPRWTRQAGGRQVEVASADYHGASGDYRLVLLRYPKPEDAAKACKAFVTNLTKPNAPVSADNMVWMANNKMDSWFGAFNDGQFVGVALRAKSKEVAKAALKTLRREIERKHKR